MRNKINVGILIFNEVEVLDFAGPFEVFSITETQDNQKVFNVFTIAETSDKIRARNGLEVIPKYNFNNVPEIDILIIPGGYGAEEIEIKNINLLNWIKSYSLKVKTLASVCTGAFLLAEIGLLDNLKATTHWMDQELLQNNYPLIKVISDVKFIDEGHILTSGGISAGIELSLYIVYKYTNLDVSIKTAKRMEYDWVSVKMLK